MVFLTVFTVSTSGSPWWEDAVFYEVFVRSYYDSDADGIGDFKGLQMKLDYIRELGANALWLM
ncbi:MAG: alpha-amylase family glycosyl hydrolase, partial [Sedimentisphaerales bacterium]